MIGPVLFFARNAAYLRTPPASGRKMVEEAPPQNDEHNLFQLALAGYLAEAGCLAKLAETHSFRTLLEIFEGYPAFLESRRDYFGETSLNTLLNINTIDFDESSEILHKLKRCINLAAACDLFEGWTIPINNFDNKHLCNYVHDAITELKRKQKNVGSQLAAKLNSGDACRVIHMLKIFGWVAPDMTTSAQLSLGASGGIRDRYSIHYMPVIRYQRQNILLREPIPELVSFELEKKTANDIVLVDNDPKMRERYATLNAEPNILALNQDAYNSLKELAIGVETKEIIPRNFIVAYRMDHRLIPDAGYFLKLLAPVISNYADLIITIGAGHSNEEFKGRLKKINELMATLETLELNPVKIKWHRGKSLSDKRENPIFGEPTYATYEILYCKLIKSNLEN